MKKLLIAAMLAGLVLTFSGCGNVVASESDAVQTEESSEQPESTEESAEASAEESTESSEESSEASEESEPEESESSEAGEGSSEPEESAEEESEEASEESRSPSAGRDTGGRVPDSPAASESSTPDSEESSSAPDNTAGNTAAPEGNNSQTGNSQANNSQTNNSQTDNSQTNSQPAAHTHTYVTQTVSEATCEQAKVVQDVCSGCGDVQNRRTEGNALGHDYQGYFVYDEPTCSYTGSSGQTCTRCGRTSINGIIPQLPHDYEATVIIEGDCRTAHVVRYTCKSCGHFYEETDQNYHANDHVWETGTQMVWSDEEFAMVPVEVTKCTVCGRDKE